MSDLGDYYTKFVKSVGDFGSGAMDVAGKVGKFFSPYDTSSVTRSASDFFKNEISGKADLRSAQILGMLSGVPVLGGLINGVQGAVQMEDLYNNTGKTPAYPGLQSLGSGGLGAAASQALRIADGRNDLYQYYAGEPDQWTINMYG